ncbi:hypothetical protein STTU_1008 [Streptomyces sp. Tu6071]|uniref:hypothetical protein n=1 Tax=Streptomyces sp. Tu6071 TaxID=355249 RepID=UPI00020E52EC|nr:hypothetical protein [Streptomyces sp. Tu6071]EGJ73797.1 hypothetical protein STTU_1008 [Streptomyces sp. Tu6071]
MIGMSETTEAEDNEVAVLTTPQEWRGFLEQYSLLYAKVRADEEELGDLLDEDQIEALEEGGRVDLWLGGAAAREEALDVAEDRLGVTFPPSLRGFFLASDGWTRLEDNVDAVHPCGRLGWMRDSEAGSRVIETYASITGNEDDVELFRRSLQIARGEDFWLLDPTEAGPDGEWAAYEFAPKYGDTTKHPSFYALFRTGYESMQEDADDEDLD